MTNQTRMAEVVTPERTGWLVEDKAVLDRNGLVSGECENGKNKASNCRGQYGGCS